MRLLESTTKRLLLALCVRLDAVLALRTRTLLLVQNPVALGNAALSFLAAVVACAATHT